MTKRVNSKFKVCKKIAGVCKNLWGIPKAKHFRSVKIFKKDNFLIKQKKNRLSAFGRYLNTKQIIKSFYCNISEQNLQKYINKSIISKSMCLWKFFSILESRVDTILYRSCLVNSLYMSRQLINHKLVFLNNQEIKNFPKLAKNGDILSVNPSKTNLFANLITSLKL